MKGIFETKEIKAEVKEIDYDKKIVTGYFSSFGNVDHDQDVIVKGAYSKSIRERGPNGTGEIFFLNQHLWNEPLAHPYVLEEDSKGLYFEAQLDSRLTYANNLLVQYELGLVKEHSVGFVSMKEDYNEDGIRIIKEIFLYEGSAVTLGANSNTPFTGFKCQDLKEAEDFISKILKQLRKGTLTDDTYIQLEIALKQLQRDAFELGKKSLEKKEPDAPTPKIIEPIDVDKAFELLLNS